MAVADQVVVQLRADTAQYMAGVERAERAFVSSMDVIEAEASAAGTSLTGMGARGGAALDNLAAKAPRAATAIRGVNTNVGNLGAQFQDIGVQLAAGTSPFTILAQQLPQITMNGGSLNGVMAALKGTVSALISPLGLATTAFVLLTSVAIPYFVELLSGSEKSEEQLKKEAQVIQEVAEKWGAALPAVKAYYDEIKSSEAEAKLIQSGEIVAADKYTAAKEQVASLGIEILDTVAKLQVLGEKEENIVRLQNAFANLEKNVSENRATAADAKAVQDALSATIIAAVPDVAALAGQFGVLVGVLNAVSAAASAAREQVAAAALGAKNLPQLGTVGPVFSGGGKFITEADVLNDRANRTKSQTQIAAERAAKGAKTGKTDAEREKEAIADLIKTLEHELSLIGMTNEQRAVANNLRKLAASATESERDQVEELTLAIFRQTEAQKDAKKTAEEFANIGKEALGGFIQDIRNGVSAADALNNALNRVLDSLLEMSLNALFSGGGGGNIFSKLFGGFRASGGSVSPGKLYGVNERGTEFFQSSQSGRIIPLTPQMSGQSTGGAGVNLNIQMDNRGADPSVIPRLEQQVRELKRAIPSMIDARQSQRSTRGTRPS